MPNPPKPRKQRSDSVSAAVNAHSTTVTSFPFDESGFELPADDEQALAVLQAAENIFGFRRDWPESCYPQIAHLALVQTDIARLYAVMSAGNFLSKVDGRSGRPKVVKHPLLEPMSFLVSTRDRLLRHLGLQHHGAEDSRTQANANALHRSAHGSSRTNGAPAVQIKLEDLLK